MLEASQPPKFTNQLAKEKSPYLLQHAHNPVNWYPWEAAAFEKSKSENKPIFLSIGYSTCHWCHVMEEESFENEEVAKILNDHFISIKVDREERPDIDNIYMSYVMATTGGGGWPMSVFLTPSKLPFYGGTYFPPQDRYGMPGFKTLLHSIAKAWVDRRDEIVESSESAIQFLSEKITSTSENISLTPEIFKDFFERKKSSFDETYGGFGSALKFPQSYILSMLLRYWRRSKDPSALAMVEKTLDEMARGGIFDQLGGGFHRYSTDRVWRAPHFEKMLYDQALLVPVYLEAFQATGNSKYSKVAQKTLDYVLNTMQSKNGAFYSAEDADSIDPSNPNKKREGAYFVWKKSEIGELLSGKVFEIFAYYYGIQEEGNAISDPHGELKQQNILHQAHSLDETANNFNLTISEVEKIIDEASQKVLSKRNADRIRPYLDDKILTDWNALMISSFAQGYQVLGEEKYRQAAIRAVNFFGDHMTSSTNELFHRFRDNEAGIQANLNDYAFLVSAQIQLYQATFDEAWLAQAVRLTDKMIELFWDREFGGFFMTSSEVKDLILRPKEFYDGALPSGNSVAALNLLLLEKITGRTQYKKYADEIFKNIGRSIRSEPTSYPAALVALDFAMGPSIEIVIACQENERSVKELLQEIYLPFLPNKIIMLHKIGTKQKALEEIAPFVKEKVLVGGNTAVYVCQNQTCKQPVTSRDDLAKVLNNKREKKSI